MMRAARLGGFTIVEVFIFLAITGLLFIMAMGAFSGREAQAEFAQSTRDLQTKLEDIINDITTSYYPGPSTPFSCRYHAGQGSAISLDKFLGGTETGGQGEHSDCVFLGKALYFDFTNGNKPTSFQIIPVAGGRGNDQSLTAVNYNQSNPYPIDGLNTSYLTDPNPNPQNVDFRDYYTLPYGLRVTRVIVVDGSGAHNVSAFNIFTTLPHYNAGVTSGSLSTNIVEVPASNINDTESDTHDNIYNMGLPATIIKQNPGVAICLDFDQGAKKAAIIMGDANQDQGTYTSLHINDYMAAVAALGGGAACP